MSWSYAKNEFGIKARDVIFRECYGKNDSGFFLVDKVETQTPGDGSNGEMTTIYCKKIAHRDGKECRGQVQRRYDVGGLKVVNQKFIDDLYEASVKEAESMRATLTGILEDVNALNV
jgi:hypothetical protein